MGNTYSDEYSTRGEYHKHIDPNWSYYPIYIRKIEFVDSFIKNHMDKAKILDAGCGEGVLVEKYRKEGKDIIGIDINVSNDYVQKGDILGMPFGDESFDLVLCLDVIEHLSFSDQPEALSEIKRVMKKSGKLLISIPNLAHKASRWKFYKKGELIRTAKISKHPGDRPIKEYLCLIKEAGFFIEQRFPIKLTLPPFHEKVLKKLLGQDRYEKYIYSSKRNPDDCFLNLFVLEKSDDCFR